MESKRIGFYVTSKSWNNFQRWHYSVAEELARRGYGVIVFTRRKNRLFVKLKKGDIPVAPVKKSRFFVLDLIRLIRLFNKHKIDTLFINYPGDVKLAGFAKKFSRIKKLLFRKGTASNVNPGMLNKLVFRRFIDAVITNSVANKRVMLNEWDEAYENTNIRVVYQGLKVEQVKENHSSEQHENKSGKLVVGISNCSFERSYCYEILKIIQRNIQAKDIQFMIYQRSDHSKLLYRIRKLKLGGLIKRNNHAVNLKEFMESVDVYLSPVASNAFNYTLLYAMIYGKPVIGINKGSNREIINHEENGFLVEEKQLNDLKDIFDKLKDVKYRRKLGENAIQTVTEKFNFEQSIDQIEEII